MIQLPGLGKPRARIIIGALGIIFVSTIAWGTVAAMSTLSPGDPAPQFEAIAHTGQQITRESLRGQPAVIYFYPKDNTSICTKQACAFRDAYEDFVAAGATVIGVSADSLESHRQFAADRKLPFLLVSDADGALQRAFGVSKTMGIVPGRVTYVIDREGIVRYAFRSQFSADRHITEALRVVRELASAKSAG